MLLALAVPERYQSCDHQNQMLSLFYMQNIVYVCLYVSLCALSLSTIFVCLCACSTEPILLRNQAYGYHGTSILTGMFRSQSSGSTCHRSQERFNMARKPDLLAIFCDQLILFSILLRPWGMQFQLQVNMYI